MSSTLAVLCIAAAASFYWFGNTGSLDSAWALLRHDGEVKRNPAPAPRAVSVVTATASTADFPIRRTAIGAISSPAVVSVAARISSQLVSIAVQDGQMVKAGDLLFQLDDRSLKAQVERDKAALAKDQATLAVNELDLDRAKQLLQKQAGTRQAYDQAVANQKVTQAMVAGDQAQLDADIVQLSYATITAPIAGRLGAVRVSVGDVVGPAMGAVTAVPLVTITQVDPLRVSFNLPESDLPLLQKALAQARPGAVTLHKPGDAQTIGQGTLYFLDSSVDTASGTITARATLPNPDLSLWPGQYVDVVLDAGLMPRMTSIPTVAVQSGQKGPYVFVVKPDNTVEIRPIKVALAEGDRTAVGEGLKSGERVVIEGQTRLADGTPVREAAEEGAPLAPSGTSPPGATSPPNIAQDDQPRGKS
jgi:multidrug efflux system membrane fusion protein